MVGWTHHGRINQQWEWRWSSEERHIVSQLEGKDEGEGTELVLDIAWSHTAPGSKVQVWSNNGTQAQKWNLEYEHKLPNPNPDFRIVRYIIIAAEA